VHISKHYLEQLITDQIEESTSLEYKAAAALGRSAGLKKEITKDVSAFANARGGLLIYGLREYDEPTKRHLPERFDPIDQRHFSREWFDQITSLIQPRIDGLTIRPIHVGPSPNDYCYVIEIPQGGTAHQATDLRYYKRRNFESVPMEDYEIRDVMNRRKHPTISASIRIAVNHPADSFILVRLTNTSKVLAQYYRAVIELPLRISSGGIRPHDGRLGLKDGKDYWEIIAANSIGHPLFPQCTLVHRFKFQPGLNITAEESGEKLESTNEIRITIYADEMEPVTLLKDPAEAEKDWT
jgi:hypothetical protein